MLYAMAIFGIAGNDEDFFIRKAALIISLVQGLVLFFVGCSHGLQDFFAGLWCLNVCCSASNSTLQIER